MFYKLYLTKGDDELLWKIVVRTGDIFLILEERYEARLGKLVYF